MSMFLVIVLVCMIGWICISARLTQGLFVLLQRETCPVEVVWLVSRFWCKSHLAELCQIFNLNNYIKN